MRTRLKRALAMLRARLDGDAGSRGAWVALLWPFVNPPCRSRLPPPAARSPSESSR